MRASIRISDLSNNEDVFNNYVPLYNQTLKNSEFNQEIY